MPQGWIISLPSTYTLWIRICIAQGDLPLVSAVKIPFGILLSCSKNPKVTHILSSTLMLTLVDNQVLSSVLAYFVWFQEIRPPSSGSRLLASSLSQVLWHVHVILVYTKNRRSAAERVFFWQEEREEARGRLHNTTSAKRWKEWMDLKHFCPHFKLK